MTQAAQWVEPGDGSIVACAHCRSVLDGTHDCKKTPNSQMFFAQLAREIRSVHFGDQQKIFVQALLHRATEAQLFDPNQVDE